MDPSHTVLLAALFLAVGALYASVGHAGASGYLAVMALMGIAPESMRSTALAVNVVVATIAFSHYAAAGHFSWRFLLPFVLASTPAAFLGGAISLPADWLRLAIGAVLAFSAVRMAIANLPSANASQPPRDPPVFVKLLAGALLGFAAGLTGTGGGIFLSPLILLCGWAEPKRTAATASLFILVNSLSGLGGLLSAGWTPPLDLVPLALAAGAGGFAGAFLGSRKATPRMLNLLLAAVLALAASKLLVPSIASIGRSESSVLDEHQPLPDRDVPLHPIDERAERREPFRPVGRTHLAEQGRLAGRDAAAAMDRRDRADALAASLLHRDRLELPARHRLVDLVVDRLERSALLDAPHDALEADSASDPFTPIGVAAGRPEIIGTKRTLDDRDPHAAHPPPTSETSATSSSRPIGASGAAKA